jgi:hypothetical protein
MNTTFARSTRLRYLGALVALGMLFSFLQITGATESEMAGVTSESASSTYRVYGHRQGLVGYTTANGHVIQPNDFFVALPCYCVLSSRGGSEFQVRIDYKGSSLILPVWDVGPWNVEDNYWDPPAERTWSGLPQGLPQAEAAYQNGYNGGLDGWGRTIQSPAGIDIGDGAFAALGMTGSDWVNVTFLWLETPHGDLPAPPASYEDIHTVYWDERPPLDDFVPPIEDGRYAYIYETGHNMPVQMLDYWYATGGWWVHGLPVSEFFREIQRDGTERFVQYFERSVLTMDLSGATSPPRIAADKLGYNTYIDPDARKPIEVFEPNPNFIYFPETGHTVAHGFKNLFETRGGVEVFGYPLSEEWSAVGPDGRKVVFQVFERARFEWWPDRVGHGDELTLGLLTLERLQRIGWIE